MLPEVTVSIGVATLSEQHISGLALLRAADEALYRAKGEGRDRVIVAEGQSNVSVTTSESPIISGSMVDNLAMIEGQHEG